MRLTQSKFFVPGCLAVVVLVAYLASDHTPKKPGPHANEDFTALAESVLADKTFENVAGSNDCTKDCSGHSDGWEWAKENEITNSDACGSKSASFIEGCQAFANGVRHLAQSFKDGTDSSH
jgi:hypothetical protein